MTGGSPGRPTPPKDPELDAAVLRVPQWRALGLGLGIAALLLPMIWYLMSVRGRHGTGIEGDWLDGSEWRVVEVERRALPREGVMTFRDGRMALSAEGCPVREARYQLTADGIAFAMNRMMAPPCGNPAMDEVWTRLPAVAGLTRYGTGLALTSADGRALVRMRR